MLRLIFRFAGLLCLAAAFAALIVDGTRSIAAGTPAFLPAGKLAASSFPDIFAKAHTWIAAQSPYMWDPVTTGILKSPVWALAGGLGLVILVLTRPARPKIGYSRR